MAIYPIRNQLLDIIYSIRPELGRSRRYDIDDVIAVSQKLETMRILLLNEEPDHVRESVGERVKTEANSLMMMKEFATVGTMRFRPRAVTPSRATSDFMERSKHDRITVAEAFDHFMYTLDKHVFQKELDFSDVDTNQLISDRLKKIVPDQKIGPVRFKISNEILEVEHSPATTQPLDKDGAAAARSALIEQNRNIIDGLRRSNCDLRFIETIQELQDRLSNDRDIIQLGIANLACEELRMKFDVELPDILAAKLRSHLSSIGMYVAQFPEWARYTENAAKVELTESDIRQSQIVANDLIKKLNAIPERVDPEVPKTIKFIMDACSDPAHTSKRAAYALFSTLENLFSKIFGYASAFTDDLVTQTSKRAATWGGSALVTVLIKAVLEGAGVLAPIYARLPDAAWIKSAVEAIKQISI